MKIIYLINGLVFLIIGAILEKEKEFNWRRTLYNFFCMTGAIFMYAAFITPRNTEPSKIEQSKPINITITSNTPEILIHKFEEEFDILKLDTINDTTYLITLCNQQKNEK